MCQVQIIGNARVQTETDCLASSMAAKEVTNETVARALCELGNQSYLDATANRREITEAGKLATAIGDWLNLKPTAEYHQRERATQSSWFSRFKDVVNDTLEWLENCGRQVDSRKLEQVLRGLYNLTELANEVHLFAIVELACACLDSPDDPFPGERQYIVQCHEDVKTQQEQIGELVKQASSILREILQNDGVDFLKGRQFDNVAREARVQIESCRRRLTGAEEAIAVLSRKMGTVTWVSRALRLTGWGFSTYFFFKRYQESSGSSIDLLKLGGCVAVTGWMWTSLLPGRASAIYESLPKIEADHRMLQEKLEDLRIRLKSAKDHRDGL